MAGQMIVLPITVAAAAGAPRIDMSIPDFIAGKVGSLKHVVSARSLTAAPGGGVAGRCRATGLPLIPRGASAATLALYEIAGKAALGINGPGSAGLGLPADSLTSSFTFVMAISLNSADALGTYPINFLSGFDAAGTYISALTRAYGIAASLNANKIGANTGTLGTFAFATPPSGNWGVLVVDYNNATRVLSVSVNQAATFVAVTMPASYAPPAGSYVEIGYHIDTSSIRNSKMGDLYTFSDSLLRTELGKAQLTDLVAALKAEYSIG
ncbi:hypothetical protein [Pseudomonas sp. RA_35y_Pfl2_P32]|uniref:hypothetical protein n=1 Tax=Pseudomonas sp. RA_35y_Pfl2_P32 TaxID=3088705 RepID=UPI0030DDCE0B